MTFLLWLLLTKTWTDYWEIKQSFNPDSLAKCRNLCYRSILLKVHKKKDKWAHQHLQQECSRFALGPQMPKLYTLQANNSGIFLIFNISWRFLSYIGRIETAGFSFQERLAKQNNSPSFLQAVLWSPIYIVIEVFPKMHVLKNNSWNLTTMRQQEWGVSTRNTKPSLLFHFRWHLLFVSTLLGLGRPMGWPTSVDLPGPMGWPMSVELTSPLTMSMGLGFG